MVIKGKIMCRESALCKSIDRRRVHKEIVFPKSEYTRYEYNPELLSLPFKDHHRLLLDDADLLDCSLHVGKAQHTGGEQKVSVQSKWNISHTPFPAASRHLLSHHVMRLLAKGSPPPFGPPVRLAYAHLHISSFPIFPSLSFVFVSFISSSRLQPLSSKAPEDSGSGVQYTPTNG